MNRKFLILMVLLCLCLLVGGVSASITISLNSTRTGYVGQSADANWLDIRVAAGDTVVNTPAADFYGGHTTSSTTDPVITYHRKGELTFPPIPGMLENDTIESITVYVDGTTAYNSLGVVNWSIVNSTPSNGLTGGIYIAGDYNRTHNIRLAPDIPYTDFSTDYNPFVFSATGISMFNKTGYNTFMLTHSADVDAVNLTWVSSQTSGYKWSSNASDYSPNISVTYSHYVAPPVSSNYTAELTPSSGLRVKREADYTFILNRNGAGTGSDNLANASMVLLSKSVAEANTNKTYRYIAVWDVSTAGITGTQLITDAQIILRGNAMSDGGGFAQDWGIGISNVSPDDNSSLVTGDFNNFLSPTTNISNIIMSEAWNTTGNNTFTLTPAGRSHLDKNGFAAYMVMSKYDIEAAYTEAASSGWVGSFDFNGSAAAYNKPVLKIFYEDPQAPEASFTNSTPADYNDPVTITFTDTSLHVPTSWNWSFGDGTYSEEQNPTHIFAGTEYTTPQSFTVSLTATNAEGEDTETKTNYISIVLPPHTAPVASFTSNVSYVVSPNAVQFTDTSDSYYHATAWLWDFGDSTTSTDQNPSHIYTTQGMHTVTVTVTNAYGSDVSDSHIIEVLTPRTHPIAFNLRNTYGYQHRTDTKYAYDETSMRTSSTKDPVGWAAYYDITGETKYANQTVTELLRVQYASTNPLENESYVEDLAVGSNTGGVGKDISSRGARDVVLGEYALAYDFIAKTKNANSTLDTANDTIIRDNLTSRFANAYWNFNRTVPQNGTATGECPGYWCSEEETTSDVTDYHDKSYPSVALGGEIFYDYDSVGAGYTSSPKDWREAGTKLSFVADTLHPTNGQDGGLFSYMGNTSSGINYLADYKAYWIYNTYLYWNAYYNIYGHPIWDDYPAARGFAMEETLTFMPGSIESNYGSGANMLVYTPEALMQTMDASDKAAVNYYVQLANTTTYFNMPYTRVYPNPSMPWGLYDYATTMDRTSTPATPKTETNFLSKTNWYQVIRGSWSDRSDWTSFITWAEPGKQQSRWQNHMDQFSIEHYSHGDTRIADTGEIKYVADSVQIDNAWGWAKTEENRNSRFNTIIVGNGSAVPFAPNLTQKYRMINKGRPILTSATNGYTKTIATVNTIIESPSFDYVDGSAGLILRKAMDISSYDPVSTEPPIDYTRAIISPNHEYMIVVDRAQADRAYDYGVQFNFGSLNITPTVAKTPGDVNGSTFMNTYNLGYANGAFSYGGTPLDWVISPVYTLVDLGTQNTVQWESVNRFGNDVVTDLYTSPASVTRYKTGITQLAGYTNYQSSVKTPAVLFEHDNNQTLYRVTAIVSRYNTESASTPSELTVTGSGSAISIVTGTETDTIYTGTGNSTLSNGINTDADTAFIRKIGLSQSDYTLINATHIYDGEEAIFDSNTRLNYISANMSATGVYAVDISGTSGSAILKFYNIATNPSYVTIDGAPASWSRTGTTLTITTALSDHSIEFDGGEGYSSDLPPVASFTPTGTTDSSAPATINFTDTSTNTPTSWLWVFGDGNTTGNTLQNPAHLYTAAGNYSVGLTATNDYGSGVSSQVTWINLTAAPIANFTATPVWGEAPLLVTFTDTSTGTPTSWQWEYSNATAAWTAFSTVQNPTITLPQGVYNFRMNATNAYGSNMKTRSGGYVTVTQTFPCGSNYAAYEDHWAKCVGSEHLEMWNVSGTVFLPKSGVTNVSYYIRGAGAGGNGGFANSAGTVGYFGLSGSTSTGYATVVPGSSYTITLGDPGVGGANAYPGCLHSTSGGASTFAGASAAGGVGGYTSGVHVPTLPESCGFGYLSEQVGAPGDPDLNYGGGGNGGTCGGVWSCPLYDMVSSTAGKRGFVTVTYANLTPVASFTPVGEQLASNIDIVTFTDTSLNAPTAWTWTYSKLGGATVEFSSVQNPSYVFAEGNYSISLLASTAFASDTSDQVTWVNVTPVPVDPNPGALLQWQFAPAVANLTSRTVTIDMKNVNITNNVSMSITFPKNNLYIQSITQNTTVWNDIQFTKKSIDNSTGTIRLNVTRPGGFTSVGQPLNAASFVDISTLYWNYSAPPPVMPGFNISPIYMRNSTVNLDYPILNYAYFDLAYQDWTTYSNFSVGGSTDAGTQTLFLPSENNFTANRWTWNFGDGTPVITGNASYPEPHTFSLGGYYNVSSTAYLWQNTSVSNTTYLTANISYDPTFVYADFTAVPTTGPAGSLIQFIDASTFGTPNATSGRTYNWSFGDGEYSSVVGSTTHVYPYYGIYTVTLIANNTLGTDTEIKDNYITITSSNAVQPQVFPKYVTFHLKDGSLFGAPLSEVGINITGISTSSGDWDWMAQLLGVPLNEVPINTAMMYQTTDTLGRATFYVIPTAKYNVTFTKAGYTIPPMILVPQDDDYIITATSATSPFFRDGIDEISAINITVTSTLYNESWAFLNFTYYDSTGHTTGGTVRVLQKSDTAWEADTVMATWPVTSSSFRNSTVVVHVQQVSGYIDANITHSDFGTIQRSYPYSFNSVPVQFLGFEQDITLIVALGIMLFTMMLGGAAHGRILLVIVSMEGWIMYSMHWFQSLFDRGVPETAFIAAIVFMFVVGILANVLMRKKRGL